MTIKVAIAGFGSIGKVLAKRLLTDPAFAAFELSAIGARDVARTRASVAETLGRDIPVVPSTELAGQASVVLECVPTPAFRQVVEPALAAGMTVISVSGAALLDHMDLGDIARDNGGKFILATGAIVGLDAMRAAGIGTIQKATMVTRKPPKSLATAKDVVEKGKDLMTLAEPECLFSGTAREGARRRRW